MFISGSQLFSIFGSFFTVLRGLMGPLSYTMTVTCIEGLKIIFVFNMSTLNCSYIIHFLIIFHFARLNRIPDGKLKLFVFCVGIISVLPNILYIILVIFLRFLGYLAKVFVQKLCRGESIITRGAMSQAYGGLKLYNELDPKSVFWANLSVYLQAGISPFIFLVLCAIKRYIRSSSRSIILQIPHLVMLFKLELIVIKSFTHY